MNIISMLSVPCQVGGRLETVTKFKTGNLEISFKDIGLGIPSETLQDIFEPLITTKSEGIGMGLSIVKDIVHSHDGSIEVKSTVGEGTTFTVKLPLKKYHH
ncbi:MAG: hypothetical protein GY781_21685 [Gammaproteobacteria bacterium]|nr:hypothetical protein [Gammaproteobacteria bacterium]